MRRAWSDAERELLRMNYPDRTGEEVAALLGRPVRSVYQQAAALGLSKSEAFLASDRSGRVQRGKLDPRMMASRFQPGQAAWNKGVKGVVGVQEACRATQFKKGRPAHEAANYLPIGSLRISKDGYLERKVTDDPAFVPARRWVAVHRLVWEEANGHIPTGHVVVFRAGRRTTDVSLITLDALELITRSALMLRNSVHQMPPELVEVTRIRASISRQINKRSKEST